MIDFLLLQQRHIARMMITNSIISNITPSVIAATSPEER